MVRGMQRETASSPSQLLRDFTIEAHALEIEKGDPFQFIRMQVSRGDTRYQGCFKIVGKEDYLSESAREIIEKNVNEIFELQDPPENPLPENVDLIAPWWTPMRETDRPLSIPPKNSEKDLLEAAFKLIEKIGTTDCACHTVQGTQKATTWINAYRGWSVKL